MFSELNWINIKEIRGWSNNFRLGEADYTLFGLRILGKVKISRFSKISKCHPTCEELWKIWWHLKRVILWRLQTTFQSVFKTSPWEHILSWMAEKIPEEWTTKFHSAPYLQTKWMKNYQRTWPGCNGERPVGDIFMKFGTLDLLLTRNRMVKVLGPKNYHLRVISGVKGTSSENVVELRDSWAFHTFPLYEDYIFLNILTFDPT
jgi:hypothetical protein